MDLTQIHFQIKQFTLLDRTGDFFRLRSGEAHQGWIEEVGETALSFVSGGPLSLYEAFEVSLDDVDLGSLAYRDEARGWVDVVWSEKAQRWLDR